MQVGVVLLLDTSAGLDPTLLVAAIGRRLPGIPRLRQLLVKVPIGCGRPIWVDSANFTITDHVSVVACPGPGGMDGVLSVAAGLVRVRLPRGRPLWSASIVTGVDEGTSALVVVFHHVLADGVAGLAILGELAGEGAGSSDAGFPRPAPTRTQLARDAATRGLGTARNLPRTIARVGQALRQLRSSIGGQASRTSLNRPTGTRQRFKILSRDLSVIREVAHSHNATVNDVVLTAITGSLHHLLAERSEKTDDIIASIPFSSRDRTTARLLGNRSGAIPLRLPATEEPGERLRAIAGITKAARASPPGSSTAVLGPLFRLLATIGLLQRFVDHQRVIHTFVTNLIGPQSMVTIGGFPVVDIVPLTVVIGNVTVSFAVFSYRGKLTITLVADPDTCPDLDRLHLLLALELDQLSSSPGSPGVGEGPFVS